MRLGIRLIFLGKCNGRWGDAPDTIHRLPMNCSYVAHTSSTKACTCIHVVLGILPFSVEIFLCLRGLWVMSTRVHHLGKTSVVHKLLRFGVTCRVVTVISMWFGRRGVKDWLEEWAGLTLGALGARPGTWGLFCRRGSPSISCTGPRSKYFKPCEPWTVSVAFSSSFLSLFFYNPVKA